MYIQKIKKTAITFFSLLLLSAMATGTASAAENKKTIDYVALGDSLAAGQKPTELGSGSTRLYGTSYPKFIRDELSGKGMLNSYANFGESGHTTVDVLADLVTYEEAIRSAEIITLDIGANDMFNQWEAEEGDVSQWLTQTNIQDLIDQVNFLLSDQRPLYYVASQVGTIVMDIRKVNPDAKIYLMGYYDAFSFLEGYSDDPELQPKIDILRDRLPDLIAAYNTALQAVVPDVTYVDTTIAIGGKSNPNARTYLPLDIHPTVQGYRAIAQAFLDAMK